MASKKPKGAKNADVNEAEDIAEAKEASEGKKKEKKEKKPKKEKKEKKNRDKSGKGGAKRVVVPIVVLLLIGGVAGIIYFNVLDIRDKYLMGILQNIPIVGSLIAIPVEETGDELDRLSIPELKQRIRNLESNLANMERNIEDQRDINSLYIEEMARLQEIESQQLQFRADKDEFDRMVAQGDPNSFVNFFEQMWPENAAELYVEAAEDLERAREMKRYVATFQTMEESSAARILEELIATDMDLVVLILRDIGNETRGAIIAAMSAENGASVAKMMAP